MRLNSPELKKKLDKFLQKYCESEEYKALKHKYFDFIPEETGEVVLLGRGKISQYDKLFKQAAKSAGWDWKFLAAIAYKESRFNPYAKGARGAFGIMQFLKPSREASFRRASRLLIILTSPVNPISPTAIVDDGIATSRAAEIKAQATAKSAAASCNSSPPTTFK